ncbi:MAG TPA: hypothetical protein VN181_00880, partial [Thermoanaerobaculia bacterium]|nr:hypothetical protein [Thermoanaerobaculia bacterium]
MKKRFLILPVLFSIAAPLLAVDECGPYRQLVALYEVRNTLLQPYGSSYEAQKHIDRTLDDLRGHGRWVRWVRPSGDGPIDKQVHTVAAAEGTSDTFEASSHHVYSVRIVVPRKRSLLNANAPVYVGDLVVRHRGKSKSMRVDAWLNPDTSRTLDLDGIVDEADASVDVATAPK